MTNSNKKKTASKLFLKTLPLLSSTALISIAATANAQEIQPGDEVKFSLEQIAGNTTGGGPWVIESETKWKRGIITAIEVCSGSAVDSITVLYDGARGTTFGGGGGSCDTWRIPADQYIQSVRVWSGSWMDAIQFVTNTGTESTKYGGNGGKRTVYEDTQGRGSLRKIDGKYGRLINGLKLGFTYPYYVGDLEYELPDDEIDFLPPLGIDRQFVNACGFTTPQTQTLSVSVTEENSHSWSLGGSATIGIETSISAGIPDIASASVKTSASVTLNYEQARAYSKTKTRNLEVAVTAQPGTKRLLNTKQKRANLDIPFTYSVIHYRDNNKNRVVGQPRRYMGKYKGTLVASTETEGMDIDCKTGQPISELPVQNVAPPPEKDPVPPSQDFTPGSSGITNDLTYVSTSNGGAFQLIEEDVWQELSDTGEARFTYDVFDRDEDCIYLLDRNRGVVIVIDVTRNKIGYAPDKDSEPFDIYDIIGAE